MLLGARVGKPVEMHDIGMFGEYTRNPSGNRLYW